MNNVTPTQKDEKAGYSWTRPRPSLTSKKHKVSFSASSKGSTVGSQDGQSSRSNSPKPWAPNERSVMEQNGYGQYQMVDRQKKAKFMYVEYSLEGSVLMIAVTRHPLRQNQNHSLFMMILS